MTGVGLKWKTRLPTEVDAWLDGLEPITPGLGDINDWRPDLPEVAYEYRHLIGASTTNKRVWGHGGFLRKK